MDRMEHLNETMAALKEAIKAAENAAEAAHLCRALMLVENIVTSIG